jgi:hypothetical protein
VTQEGIERPIDAGSDRGLARLLEAQARLQVEIEAAQAEAHARVADVCARLESERGRDAGAFEAAARGEEQADLEDYAARGAALRAEHDAALARLAQFPAGRLDELARAALAAAIGTDAEPS